MIDHLSINDIPEIINNMHTKEDCYSFLEQINDLEWHGFDPDELPEGLLALELCKSGNTALLKYTICYFEDGKSEIDYLRYEFYAELVRYACQYNKIEVIDELYKQGINYARIREECYQVPNQGNGMYDEDTSSPLAFAIEGESFQCYSYLLKWMIEAGESITKEGLCTWKGKYIFESIEEMLRKKGLSWPIKL